MLLVLIKVTQRSLLGLAYLLVCVNASIKNRIKKNAKKNILQESLNVSLDFYFIPRFQQNI